MNKLILLNMAFPTFTKKILFFSLFALDVLDCDCNFGYADYVIPVEL